MEIYDNPNVIYTYKYATINKSILGPILKPWWALVLKFLPSRMSPNMISMIGNLGSFLALTILMLFGAQYGKTHTWIFVIVAICIFFYHTFDAIDGMQARKLGLASPLGEFIDHWFDAMNVFFLPLSTVVAFPCVSIYWGIAVVLFSILGDWVTLNEVFRTGYLKFDCISTDEGILVYILFMLSIPLLGYNFWATPMHYLHIEPIKIILIILMISQVTVIVKTFIAIKFYAFAQFLLEVAFISPIILWLVFGAKLGLATWVTNLGLLTLGFVGTRNSGELLRMRLLGTRYPTYHIDMLVASIITLAISIASLFIKIPTWLYVLPIISIFALVMIALVKQFKSTLDRVYSCLGIKIFSVPEKISS